jgi:hypothetical protein
LILNVYAVGETASQGSSKLCHISTLLRDSSDSSEARDVYALADFLEKLSGANVGFICI